MKLKTMFAATLITLGTAAFAYQGITYANRGPDVGFRDTRVSIGGAHELPLLPIAGAIALIGGIAMLLVDKQDFKRAATP